MNPNGTHDKALLEEIERLLNQRKQKQRDGINTPELYVSHPHPVLDELTSLLPQASPEFEDALEARLLARFQPMNTHPVPTTDLTDLEEHRPMTSNSYLRNYQPDTAHTQHRHRSRRLPLTLAAAVIAVLFSVALLLTLSALPEDDTPVYSALLTATTASPSALNADDCPPVEGWTDTYTVRSGDTFSFIAARYGIDFDQLYQMFEANCIPEDPNYVPNVGDILRVPDVINATPTVIFTITPTIASAQLEATRILAEATQRALDGTLTFTPTPILDSMQVEATRILAEATQRTADLSATPSSGQLDATRIIADSTQQTAMNACNTEATQAAQCSESGISQTVEAAVQATLSAMGQATYGNATINSLQTVAVRDGAGADFSAFEALAPGTSVDVLGQSADGAWYQILLADGQQGWIPSEFISFARPPTLPIFVASPTATITPSITFTPTSMEEISASATFTPTITPTLTNTPTPFATFTPTPAGETTTQIVVATQFIGRGEVITEEDVALSDWSINAVPENAITTIEDVVGMRARTDIFTEQPILTSMVIEDFTPSMSDLDIPAGKRVIAIPMNSIYSVSFGLQVGDYVSIGIVPNDSTDVVAENALMLGIIDENIIHVAVSPTEAVVLSSLLTSGVELSLFLIPVTESSETRQIVVALRDIERGARIVQADVELADVPIDVIPEDAYTDLESVIGHRARVDFDEGAPINEALLVPTLNEDSEYEFDLADNAEIIEIPMRQVEMPGTGEFRNVIIESELPNGTIITVSHHAYVGYGATEVEPEEVYGIIVPTEDADLLQGFVNAGFTLRMYGFSVDSDDTEIAGIIPSGLRTVAIPMPAILMDPPLEVGDRVDVLAAIYFVDADGEFQSIVPGQANSAGSNDLPRAWVLQPDIPDDGETPQLIIQRILKNALVIQYEAVETNGEAGWVEPNENAQTPIVTLAVSPQDAVVLNYLIEANIPLAFIRAGG